MSFVVFNTLCLFKSYKSLISLPIALAPAVFGSAEVFTDRPLDQASKITNALSENSNRLSVDDGIKPSNSKYF